MGKTKCCRLCLSNDNNEFIEIFDKNGKKLNVSGILSKHCNLKVIYKINYFIHFLFTVLIRYIILFCNLYLFSFFRF